MSKVYIAREKTRGKRFKLANIKFNSISTILTGISPLLVEQQREKESYFSKQTSPIICRINKNNAPFSKKRKKERKKAPIKLSV